MNWRPRAAGAARALAAGGLLVVTLTVAGCGGHASAHVSGSGGATNTNATTSTSVSVHATSPASTTVTTSGRTSSATAAPVSVPATPSDRASVQAATLLLLQHLAAGDWDAVYNMAASPIRTLETQQSFVSQMRQQSQSIAEPHVEGDGFETEHLGARYWTQPVTFTASRTGGASTLYRSTIELALEQGQWRFLTTSTPVPNG